MLILVMNYAVWTIQAHTGKHLAKGLMFNLCNAQSDN